MSAKSILKRVDRTDAQIGDQDLCLFLCELMAGNVLFHAERTFRILTFEDSVCLLEFCCTTFRTGGDQVREDTIHNLFGMGLRLADDCPCHLLDFLHKGFAAELSFFHLLKFVFPLSGHLGGTECIDADFLQLIEQRQPFV